MTGSALSDDMRPKHEAALSAAASHLSPSEVETAFREGKAMTLEEAVRYALEDAME